MDSKLRVIAEAVGFKKLAKEASLVGNGIKSIGASTKDLRSAAGLGSSGLSSKDAASMMGLDPATFKKHGKSITGITNKIDTSKRALKGFQMEYLSTMFFGMQVWRTFGGFFKSMLDNYKQIDKKGQRPLSKGLVKLSASFQYFKFQMMDAMSGTFTPLIIKLAEGLLWLADLDERVLSSIGWGIAAIATVGLAMFTGSQVKLFLDAVAGLKTLSTMKNIKNPMSEFDKFGVVADKGKKPTPKVIPVTFGFGALASGTGALITAAILAAVGTLLIAWKFNSEEIGVKFAELREHIKNGDYGLAIATEFDLINSFGDGWLNFQSWFGDKVVDTVLDMAAWGAEFIRSIKEAIVNGDWSQVGDAFKEVFSNSTFKALGLIANIILPGPSLESRDAMVGGMLGNIKNKVIDYSTMMNNLKNPSGGGMGFSFFSDPTEDLAGLDLIKSKIDGEEGSLKSGMSAVDAGVTLLDKNVRETLNESLGGDNESSTKKTLAKLEQQAKDLNDTLGKTINKKVKITYSGGSGYAQPGTIYP